MLGTDIDNIGFIEDFIVIGNKEIRYFECVKKVLEYIVEDLILGEKHFYCSRLLLTLKQNYKNEEEQSWKRYDTFERWGIFCLK